MLNKNPKKLYYMSEAPPCALSILILKNMGKQQLAISFKLPTFSLHCSAN